MDMKRRRIAALGALLMIWGAPLLPAAAVEPLKIGLVLPMSGPFAGYGKQIEGGVRLYLKQHGDTFSGRKVVLVVKDDTGVAPEISKRVAQELVVQDKVDILAGFGLTPSAFAVAPIATEAKKPMIVMNAATSAVTTKSNFILRTSMTLPQITAPIASWAAKNGIHKVFTVVADYGPGHDAEGQFKKTFGAAGGEVVGEVRTPVKNPDFAPFLQKVKDAHPDAVFLFVPAGEQGVGFMKGFAERRLGQVRHPADCHRRLDGGGQCSTRSAIRPWGSSIRFITRKRTNRRRTRHSPTLGTRPTVRTGRTSWRSPGTMACTSSRRRSRRPGQAPRAKRSSRRPRA